MKNLLPQAPLILIFIISGNVLYFGLSPFPGNLSGTLSDSKEIHLTKVTPAPYRLPLVLKGYSFKNAIGSSIPHQPSS